MYVHTVSYTQCQSLQIETKKDGIQKYISVCVFQLLVEEKSSHPQKVVPREKPSDPIPRL